MRFRLVMNLLGLQYFPRMLEIGYGSGVFIPTLSQYCDTLYGVDVHRHPGAVAAALLAERVGAQLVPGSIERMPFRGSSLDCMVAVSALEFVDDLDGACVEMRRVLVQRGRLIAVTPGDSRLLDCGLRLLTGQSARDDFGTRRQTLVPTLLKHFRVEERLTANICGVTVYTGLRLTPD